MSDTKLVVLDNKYCRLITQDESVFESLRNFLSYKIAGAEYMPAYQYGWDGRTFLLSKKGIFYSGLLEKTKAFLTKNRIEFTVEDKRVEQAPNSIRLDLTPKLTDLGIQLRDYQSKIVEIASNNPKGIIRACTGSGKTLCIASIIAKINKPSIIYVIGLDLLKQFHDLFSSLFDEPIGFIGNGVCQIERINIASIWTVGRALKIDAKSIVMEGEDNIDEKIDESQSEKIVKMLTAANVHIFDESHVVATKTITGIFDVINPEYIYGFSGTPFRDDGTDLLISGILGEQLVDITASELIEKNVLAQPIIKFVPVPPLGRKLQRVYQTWYKEYIVENEVRNRIIVEQVKELVAKKYTVLVLFKQIKHGKILFDAALTDGIRCDMLSGVDDLDNRTSVKEKLVNKEIDVIFASTIFDIGLDLPMLSGLVLAGSGKSSLRARQRLGRILRAYPGKKHVAVVDFMDNAPFLKQHSKKRCEVYTSEPGFKLIGKMP
jgi:superfamily II DNA or RNA helicase